MAIVGAAWLPHKVTALRISEKVVVERWPTREGRTTP